MNWTFWLTLVAPGVFLAALAALILATGTLVERVAAWPLRRRQTRRGGETMPRDGFPCAACGAADAPLFHEPEWDISVPICLDCQAEAEMTALLADAFNASWSYTINLMTGRAQIWGEDTAAHVAETLDELRGEGD